MADDARRFKASEYTVFSGGATTIERQCVLAADHDRIVVEKDARIAELEQERSYWRRTDERRAKVWAQCESDLAERTRERDEAWAADVAERMKRLDAEADLAALRAEHERLKSLKILRDDGMPWREVAEERLEGWRKATVACSAAEAEVRALREALDKFGQHADGCPAWPSFPGHFSGASKVGPCSCGLSAALAQATPTEGK